MLQPAWNEPSIGRGDNKSDGQLATGEINWIDEAFPDEIKLILCDDRDQEDINEEYGEILYLTRISMEAKLIAMMVTMTFFFDETFILYS